MKRGQFARRWIKRVLISRLRKLLGNPYKSNFAHHKLFSQRESKLLYRKILVDKEHELVYNDSRFTTNTKRRF